MTEKYKIFIRIEFTLLLLTTTCKTIICLGACTCDIAYVQTITCQCNEARKRVIHFKVKWWRNIYKTLIPIFKV